MRRQVGVLPGQPSLQLRDQVPLRQDHISEFGPAGAVEVKRGLHGTSLPEIYNSEQLPPAGALDIVAGRCRMGAATTTDDGDRTTWVPAPTAAFRARPR
ncbi:MAG: hypothetical protein M3464_03010, partial [Chloroflexota bacterium]|nr:hypothetical protein [Chloroflexota bacterium]